MNWIFLTNLKVIIEGGGAPSSLLAGLRCINPEYLGLRLPSDFWWCRIFGGDFEHLLFWYNKVINNSSEFIV